MSKRTADWLARWYSTPRSARKRRGIELSLSDEAHERLESLAEGEGTSRSEIVEEMILSRAMPKAE